jgi:transcriptional regulator CtsR
MKGQAAMPNLTDYIEEYLKRLLALSANQFIEIRRRELAGKFSCVPSQINYVLERRFSPPSGVTWSKAGAEAEAAFAFTASNRTRSVPGGI